MTELRANADGGCRCIMAAHCHGAADCMLRVGGTVNAGGGVCAPLPPDAPREGSVRSRVVTVHRPADRHADLHARDFAQTDTATVDDGKLEGIVMAALAELNLSEVEVARCQITIEEPHDA